MSQGQPSATTHAEPDQTNVGSAAHSSAVTVTAVTVRDETVNNIGPQQRGALYVYFNVGLAIDGYGVQSEVGIVGRICEE